MSESRITITVNGERRELEARPMERLLDVLRVELGLTGVKEGCGEGECGACSVLLDGAVVNSCLVPVCQVDGRELLTIEGVADLAPFGALQDAFVEAGGAQCGICTPGMIIAALALARRTLDPTEAEIREALAGNICRCTGYTKIFDAVARACHAMKEAP